MQVVCSGISTPTPSPRVQRRQYEGYSRPFLRGYLQTQGSTTPPFHHKPGSREHKHPDANDSSLRDSIPAMTKPVAVTCLVLNIFIPGLGTFVSGLTVLCGARIRFRDSTKQKLIFTNTSVAFLQLATTFLFLLGWIWSIVWGVAFITISDEYYKEYRRPNQPPPKRAASADRDQNGTNQGINRAESSPGINSSCLLQKPVMLRSSSADQPTRPTIVLQQEPIISRSETALAQKRTVTDGRVRHHKVLKRQVSDDLCPFNMPHTSLEQIVIHDLPRAPVRRGILRRDDTVTSTTSSVSDKDSIV